MDTSPWLPCKRMPIADLVRILGIMGVEASPRMAQKDLRALVTSTYARFVSMLPTEEDLAEIIIAEPVLAEPVVAEPSGSSAITVVHVPGLQVDFDDPPVAPRGEQPGDVIIINNLVNIVNIGNEGGVPGSSLDDGDPMVALVELIRVMLLEGDTMNMASAMEMLKDYDKVTHKAFKRGVSRLALTVSAMRDSRGRGSSSDDKGKGKGKDSEELRRAIVDSFGHSEEAEYEPLCVSSEFRRAIVEGVYEQSAALRGTTDDNI